MVGYYGKRAREYERIYQKPERQADLLSLRRFVEKTFAGTDVFEVACGTGYWTGVLARSAASVVAMDVNEEVLAIARAKCMGQSVTFQQGDAYALHPSTRRFNAGLSAFWWSHIPKSRLNAFLRGLHRCLSPGARVVFIDNVYVEGNSTPVSGTDQHGDTYQIRRLDDGSTFEVCKNFPTESELLTATGDLASNARVQVLRYYWILSYLRR